MGYIAQSIGQTMTDWVPTLTGFSATPTVNSARYTLNGKWCTCQFNMTATTSNATTFTITLPFAAANTTVQTFPVLVADNGSQQAGAGKLNTRVNSNVADIYKTLPSGTFTGSGTKASNFVITYEIA